MRQMTMPRLFIFVCVLSFWHTLLLAETHHVRLAHQQGWMGAPFYVMAAHQLIEKHAQAAHLPLTAHYTLLTERGTTSALLANAVDFGAVDVPTLIMLHARSEGDYKVVCGIGSFTLYLNTREQASNLCYLSGPIAVPHIQTSAPSILLKMAAQQQCGDPHTLDAQLVSYPPLEGQAALLSEKVASHFSPPPIAQAELQQGKGHIRTLLRTTHILKDPASSALLVGSESFRLANPNVHKVVTAAFEEALSWMMTHPSEAASLYQPPLTADERLLFEQHMASKDLIFEATPRGLEQYAHFMKQLKLIARPYSWKQLVMPHLHEKDGSSS